MGFYKTVAGSSACTRCPSGSYTATLGSTSISSCICYAGSTGINGVCTGIKLSFLKFINCCEECPDGTYSNVSGSNIPCTRKLLLHSTRSSTTLIFF